MQLVIWFVIPVLKYTTADNANHTLSLIVLIQYVPRITIIFPLNRRIIKTAGIVAKSPWSGSVYNLLMYILISHVSIYIIDFLHIPFVIICLCRLI